MTPGVGSISGRITERRPAARRRHADRVERRHHGTTTSLTEGDRGLLHVPAARRSPAATRSRRARRLRHPDPPRDAQRQRHRHRLRPRQDDGVDHRPRQSSNGGPLPGPTSGSAATSCRSTRPALPHPTPDRSRSTTSRRGRTSSSSPASTTSPPSQIVTIAPGRWSTSGSIVLHVPASDRTSPRTAGSGCSVVDSAGADLTGATVRLVDVGTGELVRRAVATRTVHRRRSCSSRPADRHVPRRALQAADLWRRRATDLDRARTSAARRSTVPARSGVGADPRLARRRRARRLRGDVVPRRPKLQPAGERDAGRCPAHPGARTRAGQDQIRWETPPNSLISGIYRVRVTRPPPGYRVRDDQVLVDTQPAMQFVVRPTDEAPIMLNDLKADILPSLTGAVVVPQRDPDRDDLVRAARRRRASSCRSGAVRSAR